MKPSSTRTRALSLALRRWVAAVFLLMMAFYVTEGLHSHCHEGEEAHHQVCTLVCSDGCATAPIPKSPVPPPPDALPEAVYAETAVLPILNFDLEPETGPPRR